MIIYRIFFGFCGVCVFYTSMFMVPKRALLSTLATPPVSFYPNMPTGTSSSFFALRKTPFHSRLYWSGVSLFHFSTSPVRSFCLGHGWAASQAARCPFTSHVSFPPLRLSLAWKKVLAVFLCFYQVPILYRDIYRRVPWESPPSV